MSATAASTATTNRMTAATNDTVVRERAGAALTRSLPLSPGDVGVVDPGADPSHRQQQGADADHPGDEPLGYRADAADGHPAGILGVALVLHVGRHPVEVLRRQLGSAHRHLARPR